MKDLADLVIFSQLRYSGVFQRPHQLMSRYAERGGRVLWLEEPEFTKGLLDKQLNEMKPGLFVLTPQIPEDFQRHLAALRDSQRRVLDYALAELHIEKPVLWYNQPMAWRSTRHLRGVADMIVYDCMDQLSAFKGAPRDLPQHEADLVDHADLVFTGGYRLYQGKQQQYPHIFRKLYPFPSGVKMADFLPARLGLTDPPDQKDIPHPRIGFFGVLDERLDIDLLDAVAQLRPDVAIVMIGPVVKIDERDLPRHDNIHYLGGKHYRELPAYAASWDAGFMMWARNESTEFISPTKTPEMLAAGLPVISTAIHDVVHPYGDEGIVHIVDTAQEFVAAIDAAMAENKQKRWNKVDQLLRNMDWDAILQRMLDLMESVRQPPFDLVPPVTVRPSAR